MVYKPYPWAEHAPKGVDGYDSEVLNLLGDGTELNGQYAIVHNLSGADATDPEDHFYGVQPDDSLTFAQVHAYIHASGYLGRLHDLGYADTTRVHVLVNDTDLPMPAITDMYTGAVHMSRGYYNAAYDKGNIVHEVQHFVNLRLGFATSSNVTNPTTAGAVQEALAYFAQARITGDPEILVWSGGAADCGSSTYYPRTVANDSTYFNMAHYGTLHVCGFPVNEDHTNSLILAGALWDLHNLAGGGVTDTLVLNAIPYLPQYPDMGCMFDAITEVDNLVFSGAHLASIATIRNSRGLNCYPQAKVDGLSTILVGDTVTYSASGVAGHDCGVLGWTTTGWNVKRVCSPDTCSVAEYSGATFNLIGTTVSRWALRAIIHTATDEYVYTPWDTVRVYYPLSASISGPSSVDVSDCESKSWSATVSGNGPFTYVWKNGNTQVGTSATLSYLPASSFTLSLRVTDVDGQILSPAATKAVTVTGFCDPGSSASKVTFSADLQPGGTTVGGSISTPAPVHARLDVWDVAGRHVATPLNGLIPAGQKEVHWDATGQPSGIYFLRLRAGGAAITRRAVLIR